MQCNQMENRKKIPLNVTGGSPAAQHGTEITGSTACRALVHSTQRTFNSAVSHLYCGLKWMDNLILKYWSFKERQGDSQK